MPIFFTEVLSNGGNLGSSINESSNPNVTYQNISVIDCPNLFYCSIWAMILGTGTKSYSLGLDASIGAGSAFCSGPGGGSAMAFLPGV